MTDTSSPEPNQPAPPFKGLIGLAMIAVLIPTLFYLRFGMVDGYALAFTAFLVMMGAAVEFLPQATDKAAAQHPDPHPVKQRWFDMLGVVWLLAIPLAPFFTWILRNMVDIDQTNWTWVLGVTAFFCVVVPLVCVLPLLRYIRRGTAGMALTVLAIGTGFPVATGAGSAYDVIRGPEWQSVTIENLRGLNYKASSSVEVNARDVFVDLADGRTLSRASSVELETGPARLLVLRGIGRVIAAE
jgi:hypothetical protein